MFETSAISTSSAALETATVLQQNDMGKEQFLELLVTQLQNQDPLSPLESQEFASQLAQFSNVELLGSIDTNILDGMNADFALAQSVNNTLAANFIGKEVTIFGDHFQLSGEEQQPELKFRLGAEADDVTINIFDENGNQVRTLTSSGMDGGMQTFEWDGKGDDGLDLLPGTYTYNVEASDSDGNPIEVAQLSKGMVEAVKYAGGNAVLVVNGEEVYLADVLQIGAA